MSYLHLSFHFRELPEPILTTDFLPRFEEAAALATSTEQEKELKILIEQQLPLCNRILLSWIFLHFDAIITHEKHNKFNPQNLAVVLSPVLQMSHRLFVTLLCYCTDLFADVELTKWVTIIWFLSLAKTNKTTNITRLKYKRNDFTTFSFFVEVSKD